MGGMRMAQRSQPCCVRKVSFVRRMARGKIGRSMQHLQESVERLGRTDLGIGLVQLSYFEMLAMHEQIVSGLQEQIVSEVVVCACGTRERVAHRAEGAARSVRVESALVDIRSAWDVPLRAIDGHPVPVGRGWRCAHGKDPGMAAREICLRYRRTVEAGVVILAKEYRASGERAAELQRDAARLDAARRGSAA
eukprot:5722047-Prymnesium_polylepis.1